MMGEISTGSYSEIERIKEILMEEFKIHQRMIRSTAVEYQTLLKKTAVRLTSGLESIYKEKFQQLDDIASKMASGDNLQLKPFRNLILQADNFFSAEFCNTIFSTYDISTVQLRNAIESLNVSPSKGYNDLRRVSMSSPSLEIGTEVTVDVTSGITKQGVFWLQLLQLPENNLLALADFQKQISVRLIREKHWKSFKDSATSPEMGDYVLVDTWNGWMRGKIEKLKDDNTYAVRLVDYGDLTSCGPDILFPMKSEICPDSEYQALRCCLSLDGYPFDLPIEAVWAFNDLMAENLVARNPVTCLFKQHVFGKDNEKVCQVDLMVKDKKHNSISVSQALNQKIEDKMKGKDSIACRDIRYSAKECAVSRYVERPAVSSSETSTPVVSESAAEAVNQSPAAEPQKDPEPGREVVLDLTMLDEQLITDKQEDVVLSENPVPTLDGCVWSVGLKDSVAESSHRVEPPDRSDGGPEQFMELGEAPSVVQSFSEAEAFPLGLQNLLHMAPVYSPVTQSSENLAATLDKPSTLKADAVPFVSRSQTRVDLPANPISALSADEPLPFPFDGCRECIAQEESVMDVQQYIACAMNLPMHHAIYAGAKPHEFGGNLQGMAYGNQGLAYSYMPPSVLNPSGIPSYPFHSDAVQGSYSHQETVDSDVPIFERSAEEPKPVEHFLPNICPHIGSQFTGEVTSQLEVNGNVWMQPTRTSRQEEAWNRMQATLSTCNKLTLPVASEDVVPGSYVTLPSSKTSELYRAEVLSVTDRKAVLRCIDYGKTVVAPKDSLKPLLDKVRSLPRQAIPCRVFDSCFEGGMLLDEHVCRTFDDRAKGRTMTADVMSVEPGNPDICAVKLRDSTGRNVMDDCEHYFCHNDRWLASVLESPDAFNVGATLGSMQGLTSPVRKLMTSYQRLPPVDVAKASLALNSLPFDPSIPPPSLSHPSSQMGDASSRMMLTQTFSPLPDTQNEWNGQQTRVDNETNHHLEMSEEMPKERYGRSKRGGGGSRQPRFRDDNQRSTPPLCMHNDGSGQQVADDDRYRFGRKNSNYNCFNCGQTGHHKKDCPSRQQSKKGQDQNQGRGGNGRNNWRK